jgi:hypothetical protein
MNWHLVLAALLAVLLPAALLITGVELRRVRLRIVEDLRNTVFAGPHSDLPQLRLAQARYDRARNSNAGAGGRQDEAKQYLGALIYALVCLLGFVLLFDPYTSLINGDTLPGLQLGVADALFWNTGDSSGTDTATYVRRSVATAGFAFLGGYVFNISYLVQQTLNQELSALAFARAALRLIQGVFLAVAAFHVFANVVPGGAFKEAVSESGFVVGLGAAFIFGYYPDPALRLISRSSGVAMKYANQKALEKSEIIPLEIIEGIDHVTSFRLQENNLHDVQNLAVANPIELYVETPYTLVQTFDWVLQAQLCLVVGVDAFIELRRHRIRTIFDLERAVLSKGVPGDYLRAIASVILSDSTPCFRKALGLAGDYQDCAARPVAGTDLMIRHVVAIISDDLHVHRLRALWGTFMKNTGGLDEHHKTLWLFDVGWLPGDVGTLAPMATSPDPAPASAPPPPIESDRAAAADSRPDASGNSDPPPPE